VLCIRGFSVYFLISIDAHIYVVLMWTYNFSPFDIVMEETFMDRAAYMQGNGVMFVCCKWRGYVLCIVSDEGEAEVFLR